MPDKEKVIEGLQKIIADDWIWKHADCFASFISDAVALLKEHEAVKVQYTAMGGLRYGACPQCDARVDNLVNPKACGFCGQELKWE